MSIIKWLDDNFEESVMKVLLCLIVVVMGLQVFMRYVMNNSLSWAEEISRYFFIWFTFLGVSYSVKNEKHIRVDILKNYIPEKIWNALIFIGYIIFMIFCGYLIINGWSVITSLFITQQSSPALRLPMYVVYLSFFVGLILTAIRIVQKIIEDYVYKNIK